MQVTVAGEVHHLKPLSETEKQLLFYIRTKFRFGEITIAVRNGEPKRILRAFESEALDM